MKSASSSLIVALLLLCHSSVMAAVAAVQVDGISSTGSVSSLSKVITAPLTSGNALVVSGAADAGRLDSGSTGGVSDGVNTYVLMRSCSDASPGVEVVNLVLANNVTAGSTTVTLTPTSSDYISMQMIELSGVKNTSPVQGTWELNDGGFDSDNGCEDGVGTSDIINIPAAGIVLASVSTHSIDPITQNGSWTLIGEEEDWNNHATINFVYRIVTPSNYSHTWSPITSPTSTVIGSLAEEPAAAAVRRARPTYYP